MYFKHCKLIDLFFSALSNLLKNDETLFDFFLFEYSDIMARIDDCLPVSDSAINRELTSLLSDIIIDSVRAHNDIKVNMRSVFMTICEHMFYLMPYESMECFKTSYPVLYAYIISSSHIADDTIVDITKLMSDMMTGV